MKHAIQIGDRAFSSKKEAEEAIRAVLHGYAPGEDIPFLDQCFISDMLALHPEAEKKIGPGIVKVSVRRTEYAGVGFLFHRLDGTEIDASYKKCIRPPSHREDVIRALRQAVALQVIAFADAAFAEKDILLCPLNGTEITRRTCHVDHHPPFWSVVEDFMEWPFDDERSFEKIVVVKRAGVSSVVELEDRTLHEKWIAWHKHHAKLRVTSIKGNLEKGAKT